MTTDQVALPARTGQATQIEQSRAIAEVQAAIVVAQQCPRDVQNALRDMRESCQMKAVADRAFFRFSRAGSTVSGPSIHLARELARCWGNIQYGVSELSRDDVAGQSEMQAFAWDIQTNTRAATIFIVPHKRDTKGGAKELVDMRDIYENNANAGARRVRECIFSVLPPWFREEAIELATKTITDGGGVPLQRRISDVIEWFGKIGVTEDDIARKLGRSSAKWTAHEVAQLGVTYRSISRGEVSREDEFPPATVTAAEITSPAPAASPNGTSPKPKADQVAAFLTELGIGADHAPRVLAALAGRSVTSPQQLKPAEADTVHNRLRQITAGLAGDDALNAIETVVAELTEQQGASS